MNITGDGDETTSINSFEIVIITFLLLSYILIGVLFALLCYQRRKRQYKLNSKNNELQLTVKQAPLQQVEERGIATAVANTEDNNNSSTGIAYNAVTGLPPNVSITNPNYMSNVASSGLLKPPAAVGDRESKRLSNISEHNRRYSQHPPPVISTAADSLYNNNNNILSPHNEVEDTYSLAAQDNDNESEHNYSVISTEETAVIGRLSPDRDDEDSEHNYSCISNASSCRLPSVQGSIPKGEEEEEVPADYEEFYSIAANPNSNISESDGEGEESEVKAAVDYHGNLKPSIIFNDNLPTCRNESPHFVTSRPHRPVRTKERSATSIDEFGGKTSDEGAPVCNKPTPKPRLLRKAVVSENFLK